MLRFIYVATVIIQLLPIISSAQTNQHTSPIPTDTIKEGITRFFKLQASVRYIYTAAIHPAGTAVAWCADKDVGQRISLAFVAQPHNIVDISAATGNEECNESEPQFSPDGKEIAFLSDAKTKGQLQVFLANAATGALLTQQPISYFNGYVSHLQWSPDGKYLSVLYVHKSTREPSPMAAEDRATGIIDSMENKNVQRIAVINRATGAVKEVTPEGLYIFEYDWSPDSKQFIYNAALPPGDDNWYISNLYKQNVDSKDTVLLYQPTFQITVPRWSADGKKVAFIEGLMSDQGGSGGEIYVMDADGNGKPKNLTPGRTSTPSWLCWQKNGNILFTEFMGGSVAICSLNTWNGAITRLWQGDEYIRTGNEEMSLAVVENKSALSFAVIRSGWNQLPEVWAGNVKKLMRVTHLNDSVIKPMLRYDNVMWTNEGKNLQGWLLYPKNYDSTKKYPMLVCVHGGPAWVSTPAWSAPDFNTTVYPQFGYFVFFPNARGSYGQGETFTQSNRRDWGFGDLRDIVTGIDAVAGKLPVDTARVGILGWSYGGSMAMMSVTQTHRFAAAVSGAGAGDWLSYYGQNSIDKWMNSYMNVSPYNDPEPYRKVSAMTYIKSVKTPVLLLVGERDGECPPPQSFQYWHALKELNVPTQLVVYADEGHSFYKWEDMIDVSVRTLEWFERWMPVKE
jgi:dipeptidyl aminopeptidase/acylaminoacyl peptidase